MKFLSINLLLICYLVEYLFNFFFLLTFCFCFLFFYYWLKFIYFGYKFFVIHTRFLNILNIFFIYYGNISLYISSYCFILGGGGLVTKSFTTLGYPWTVACQAPLSMGFFQARVLEWVAISFCRDLPDPRIKPGSPALQADSLLNWAMREAPLMLD